MRRPSAAARGPAVGRSILDRSPVPRPALALLVIIPMTPTWDASRTAEDAGKPEYAGKGDAEPVIWFKQTIGNACGSIGLIHCLLNNTQTSTLGRDRCQRMTSGSLQARLHLLRTLWILFTRSRLGAVGMRDQDLALCLRRPKPMSWRMSSFMRVLQRSSDFSLSPQKRSIHSSKNGAETSRKLTTPRTWSVK